MSSSCVVSACCCCHHTCDCDNIVFLCSNQGECLCLRSQTCCAIGHTSIGCGCCDKMHEDECCKIALPCCSYSLIVPGTFCAAAQQCLCYKDVASCPCNDNYVKSCVCAYCCISCAPTCGCCVSPPPSPALERLQRGELSQPVKETVMTDRA
jgi:hypothetical protein